MCPVEEKAGLRGESGANATGISSAPSGVRKERAAGTQTEDQAGKGARVTADATGNKPHNILIQFIFSFILDTSLRWICHFIIITLH